MRILKKAGIIAGATIGGVLGGTLSVIGKVSNQKFVDQLGESIVDSTILTGGMVGEVFSGTTEVISGTIKKDASKKNLGKKELKTVSEAVVDNVVNNFKTVAESGGEILDGVKKRDHKKVVRSTKRLVKIVLVGTITVGAIKITDEES